MAHHMTQEDREQFLAGVHVGVFTVADNAGRGPLAVPVWYLYEAGGEIAIWTGKDSRKARLLAEAGRFSFCVQDERPPYKYVTVEGAVTAVTPASLEELVRPLAIRYLGAEAAESYLADLGAEGVAGDIMIRMKPERWYSLDFSS